MTFFIHRTVHGKEVVKDNEKLHKVQGGKLIGVATADPCLVICDNLVPMVIMYHVTKLNYSSP